MAFNESYRTIAADSTLHPALVGLVDPAEMETLRAVIALTGMDAADVLGSLSLVPVADRPSGPGSGWALMAFTHPGRPSRFTDGARGVWYGAQSVSTSIAEIHFHTERWLRQLGEPPQIIPKSILHARITGVGVDLRRLTGNAYSQVHDPDPTQYVYAQAFGATRFARGDDLIVYHSVRAAPPRTHTCIAVLRPRAIRNAELRYTVSYFWDGQTLTVGPVAPLP